MKWDMEIEEIEAVLEKIWDLHDKLSDAIHSISRIQFLNSIKKSTTKRPQPSFDADAVDAGPGFVFIKGYTHGNEAPQEVFEAKSLTAIRSALENLEDQLEFFHAVQIQQRSERNVAIARLEQSRIILSMRLAEHNGKKYKVIDETLAFVGDVLDGGRLVSPENLYSPMNQSSVGNHEGRFSNLLMRLLLCGFSFVKSSLKMDHMGGIMGNAALIAVTMLTMLQIQKIGHGGKLCLDHPLQMQSEDCGKTVKKSPWQKDASSSNHHHSSHMNVFLARG